MKELDKWPNKARRLVLLTKSAEAGIFPQHRGGKRSAMRCVECGLKRNACECEEQTQFEHKPPRAFTKAVIRFPKNFGAKYVSELRKVLGQKGNVLSRSCQSVAHTSSTYAIRSEFVLAALSAKERKTSDKGAVPNTTTTTS